ncbi:hypothetical protein D9619_012403 [Psilocybe cf. subviscida]|uniref:Uncharacterized protein n=1 Tax=Psilocybe cf. subviscida TaxID=2480587 RepID=A0A8H5ARC9_9AGAR|nr:hypothetical protein D9619_012403 [Psilocybe cf. subviscida]
MHDPGEYLPERYRSDGQLKLSVRQPEAGAYGFGRRYHSISSFLKPNADSASLVGYAQGES